MAAEAISTPNSAAEAAGMLAISPVCSEKCVTETPLSSEVGATEPESTIDEDSANVDGGPLRFKVSLSPP